MEKVPPRRNTAEVEELKIIEDVENEEALSRSSKSPEKSPKKRVKKSPIKSPVKSPTQMGTPRFDPIHEDDSSEQSGEDHEYVSEEEEEDLNAILKQVETDLAQPQEGNMGALKQLYTVDERKRTDMYRPRRSLYWTLLYVVFGLGLPAIAAIGMLLQLVRVCQCVCCV